MAAKFFNLKNSLGIAMLMLLLVSCKKSWFDAKSDKSLAVLSTLQDFEFLLDEFNTMNTNTPGLGEIASDGHYIPQARWQRLSNSSQTNAQKNAYTWSNNFPYLRVRDWELSYKRIFICNLALEGLKKIEPATPAETKKRDELIGNALFHRAKNFFDLAQIYAAPYFAASASTDIGIPLKDKTDILEASLQSSTQATYDKIISDLLVAKDLLPDLPQFLSRGSKAATFALLARTYLMMGAYSEAAKYADSCLNISNILMDFNAISASASNLGMFNKETIFFSTMLNYQLVFQNGLIFINPSLFSMYDSSDLRKTRFFIVNAQGIKFKGNYNRNDIPFTGLATDEVYLIRAECYAREGNVTKAMEYLNNLLQTRWNNTVTFEPVTAVTPDEALDKILVERKKELLMRGLRWSDLKRLNLDLKTQETLNRTIDGKTETLEPNSYKYTFPVPQDVLNLAPQMRQTPGWE